jgi:predicted nucleotidyltransferase
LVNWVPDLTTDLVAEFHPIEVHLFGSVARDDDDGDSDIDILIVLDNYDPADGAELKRRALVAVTAPIPFDVTFTDIQRLHKRSRIAGSIERAATVDGRITYHRE